MKIIGQSFHFLNGTMEGDVLLKNIEEAGRTCYKSEDKITADSAGKFAGMMAKLGHEAMLEHSFISVKVVTDRGISHEIVRHRLFSFAQESTRYCNYSKDKFNNEITVVKPVEIANSGLEYDEWEDGCRHAENKYFRLLELGVKAENARGVLPTNLKTELVISGNVREFRHFFKLRHSPQAHPDVRELAGMMLKEFKVKYPFVFDDIS